MFVELLDDTQHLDAQICRRIMSLLFKHNIRPLPFATSIAEIREVLVAMKGKQWRPGVFVVNTYWADGMLSELDTLMGPVPALFLRRRVFSRETQRILKRDADGGPTTAVLQVMSRPMSILTWKPEHVEQAAQDACQRLLRFLEDDDFSHLRYNLLSPVLLMKGRKFETIGR